MLLIWICCFETPSRHAIEGANHSLNVTKCSSAELRFFSALVLNQVTHISELEACVTAANLKVKVLTFWFLSLGRVFLKLIDVCNKMVVSVDP